MTKRMFEHLRNTLKIIPPPIKQSRGKGMIALYPESALRLLQHILLEQANGLTFAESKTKLKDEIREAHEETQFWREEFSIKAITAEQFLKEGDQPASSIKMKLKKDDILISKGKAKKGTIKKELKSLCHSWDGKSMDVLREIKTNIELLEKIQVSERVMMEVKSK